MLRNHALKIQMVKTDKLNVAPETEVSLETKYAIIARMVENGVEKIGKAAITYVLVDTLRQIAIAKATRPR